MVEKFTVREHRVVRGISQEEMAKRLGITPNTYRKWESEPLRITMGFAFEIAKIFEVSVNNIDFTKQGATE